MTAPRAERRLAAILAADVVGYSRLMEADEAGTLERLKLHRKEFVEPLIAEHRGRIVKLMGDGALVEFASVVDAVACAVAVQEGMAGRERDLPEAERIRFRIGVNLGDVIVEGDDIYGDGVNVAARLEGLAEPGGVCVSGKVREELRKRLELAFAPMGRQRVKNLAEPVEAWRVVLGGVPGARRLLRVPRAARRAVAVAVGLLLAVAAGAGGWWWQAGEPGALSLPDRPSIAVLPFANPAGDAKQGRLADGLTEDLIIELARYRDLFVIARGSVVAYEGQDVDVRQVGRDLGVRYVLQGGLEGDPDRVRVTAQLADAVTGGLVWSERYDRPLVDFFALRDDLVGRITGSLANFGGVLASADAERARRTPPASMEAFDLLAIARDIFRSGMSKDNMAEARAYLEKALAIDPGFARAWFQLAWTHFNDALNGWSEDPARSWALFYEAARRAEAADPADAAVQGVAGVSYFRQRKFGPGELAWQRALVLGPNDASPLRDIGCVYAMALGTERAAEGLELVRRALRLNPNHPAWQLNCLGFAAYYAGQYEEAMAALQNANDDVLDNHVYLAMAYAELGRPQEVAVEVAAALRLKPGFSFEAYVDNDVFRPGGTAAAMMLGSARMAGLPLCASPAEAANFDPKNRLPECEAERAKATTAKT